MVCEVGDDGDMDCKLNALGAVGLMSGLVLGGVFGFVSGFGFGFVGGVVGFVISGLGLGFGLVTGFVVVVGEVAPDCLASGGVSPEHPLIAVAAASASNIRLRLSMMRLF